MLFLLISYPVPCLCRGCINGDVYLRAQPLDTRGRFFNGTSFDPPPASLPTWFPRIATVRYASLEQIQEAKLFWPSLLIVEAKLNGCVMMRGP